MRLEKREHMNKFDPKISKNTTPDLHFACITGACTSLVSRPPKSLPAREAVALNWWSDSSLWANLCSRFVRECAGVSAKNTLPLWKAPLETGKGVLKTGIRFLFYIQSFSLTECIGIVWVGKYRVVCLSVCLCVCVCVCLSVCARTPKLLGWFQWNFPQRVSYISSCVRLSFSSLT